LVLVARGLAPATPWFPIALMSLLVPRSFKPYYRRN
jgi:hypothetical protein